MGFHFYFNHLFPSLLSGIYQLMIRLIDLLKGIFLCLLFTVMLRAIEIYIEARKEQQRGLSKTQQVKAKILLTSLGLVFLVGGVYRYECRNNKDGAIGLLECVYINPGKELARSVAIALFINTTLFLGGLHQELYNGRIRKKFMRFYKREFQWNLFKKLFIVIVVMITQVPVCLEMVYRALLCRIVDPHLNHPSFFTFLSGVLFSLSHYVNYFSVRDKYGASFAGKTIAIQMGYNLVFGLYISHIFARSSTLISSLVLQVYANFMGYPEYFEVLKGNMHDDRVRKTAIFYLCGAAGCLSCCLFL